MQVPERTGGAAMMRCPAERWFDLICLCRAQQPPSGTAWEIRPGRRRHRVAPLEMELRLATVLPPQLLRQQLITQLVTWATRGAAFAHFFPTGGKK